MDFLSAELLRLLFGNRLILVCIDLLPDFHLEVVDLTNLFKFQVELCLDLDLRRLGL